jgi:hypothetical protein
LKIVRAFKVEKSLRKKNKKKIKKTSFSSFFQKCALAFLEQKSQRDTFLGFYQVDSLLLCTAFYVLKILFKLLNAISNKS